MSFAEDSRTARFVDSMGVKNQYLDSIHYTELCEDWRIANIGRDKALDEEVILEYASLMEQGSVAPAVIVKKTRDGYAVLDGVQRLRAGETLGYTRFSAYVIQTSSESKIHALRILSNARLNGNPPPKEWLLRPL